MAHERWPDKKQAEKSDHSGDLDLVLTPALKHNGMRPLWPGWKGKEALEKSESSNTVSRDEHYDAHTENSIEWDRLHARRYKEEGIFKTQRWETAQKKHEENPKYSRKAADHTKCWQEHRATETLPRGGNGTKNTLTTFLRS